MKCIILLLSIISSFGFGMDLTYQLPTKETIKERLNKAELQAFADQSRITDAFKDDFFSPTEICYIVKHIVGQYNNTPRIWSPRKFEDTYDNNSQHTKSPTVAIVVKLLLQDHPRVLIALERNYDGSLLQ